MMNLQKQITSDIWTEKAKKHQQIVSPYTDAFIARREIGLKHVVHDFLFVYYNCSPKKLKQWVPSFKETLVVTPDIKEIYPWFIDYWFLQEGELLSLNTSRLPENTRGLAKFISELCANILSRPPRFHCFGLHEWAMVYQMDTKDLRHQGQKLRLSPEELARFVKSQKICCSHYDAFRFFTEEAKPLNSLNPVLETRLQMEQSGCLHANMDLYKWSIKLWPWIGSDFIAKTFLLALEGRELDMKASPYDLTQLGYPPLCIETEEGRKEYQNQQQLLTARSTPLREELRVLSAQIAAL